MKEKIEPIKREVITHINEELPRAKIVIGKSVIICKNDSMFGNIIAYEISTESDIPAIKNFINHLNKLFNE